ncbi:MAG: N-acetyltransferase family protein [Flavobacteriales bacterium]
MQIRIAVLNDIEAIRNIAFEVWPVAYNTIISKEQIDYMLDRMYSPESLLHQMQKEGCEFLIAEENGHAIGFSSSAEIEKTKFKLHKLYVLSTMHGKGYGVHLLQEVCRRASQRGGISVELQVNKNNPAYQFYLRNGFQKDSELVLDIGNGFVMDDFILTKSLP